MTAALVRAGHATARAAGAAGNVLAGAAALVLPDLDDDPDGLTAALRWTASGWAVLPVAAGSKHPGSVVGRDWPSLSSRDPQQLAAWFAGTDHGIALHLGRSGEHGVVVFDVDHPDQLDPVVAVQLAGLPFQSTDGTDTRRGHYFAQAPAGRPIGNGVGTLGAGLDVRGRNGVVIAAPSLHARAATGGRYAIVRPGPVPAIPAELLGRLPAAQTSPDDVATAAEVVAFRAEHATADRPRALQGPLTKFDRDVAAGASRHATAVACVTWAAKEARAGLYPAGEVFDALAERFAAAMAAPRTAADRAPSPAEVASEWAGIVAWSVAAATAADPVEVRATATRLRTSAPAAARPTEAASGSRLPALVTHLRGYLDLPDPAAALVALAVAVSASAIGGEPLWVQLVGSPSSGKTEAVRLLDAITDDRLDEITAAALLSWTRHKTPKPTGVLTRLPDRPALVTIGDFSTVLASSDRGARDQLFALLRRVFDGAVTRDMGNAPEPLRWSGRLTLLSAVTHSIDNYSAHSDALGPRWLYLRLPEVPHARRRARAQTSAGDLTNLRAQAADLAATVVTDARARLGAVVLTADTLAALGDAAVVVCAGRGDVPRDGYGRREVIGVPTVEEPHRLVGQLQLLCRSLIALRLPVADAVALSRRAALDTMPRARLAALSALAVPLGQVFTVQEIAALGQVHRTVAAYALEELRELRLAVCPLEDDSDADDYRKVIGRRNWHAPDSPLGELARQVLAAARTATATNLGNNTPNPPEMGEQASVVHSLSSWQAEPVEPGTATAAVWPRPPVEPRHLTWADVLADLDAGSDAA